MSKKKTAKQIASSGGVDRANALTPKRKREIAKAGAMNCPSIGVVGCVGKGGAR